MKLKLAILTAITMVAFAANSIFCRLALSETANDPLSFTLLRLASGAIVLLPLFIFGRKSGSLDFGIKSLGASLMLFSYALFFSLAYVQMTAGTGALIVFPAAQMTMLGYGTIKGAKLQLHEKLGVILALCGLIYLVLPGFDVPPLQASAMMLLSGVSWGAYSLLGKNTPNPVFATARNFVFTLPAVAILFFLFSFHLTSPGMLWAVLSGSLTSALGYVLWYVVLKDLDTTTAAVALLSSPAIAAFGGILFLNEKLSLRLIVASSFILGGLYLKVSPRTARPARD